MAILTGFGNAWTAIGAPTASAEIWQCTEGIVEITTEAAPQAADGIRLEAGRGVPVSQGKTVRYRKVGDTAAVIRREAL